MSDAQALATPEPRQAWDQMDHEPDHSYRAFLIFRDSPMRRMGEVLRGLQTISENFRTERTIYAWRHQYMWDERVKPWDAMLQREAEQAQIEAVREAGKRHVQAGRLMQAVGSKKLTMLTEDAGDVEPGAAGQLIEAGIRVERQALGLGKGQAGSGDKQRTIRFTIHAPAGAVIEGEASE